MSNQIGSLKMGQKFKKTPAGEIPVDWDVMPFLDAVHRNWKESKESEEKIFYKREGQYPIIDQGSNLIAGYTNDDSKVYKESLPLIVFGDHTRILKYVDFPFVSGADGTQLIMVNQSYYDPKFFYFALELLKIPNMGYSRHFKIVKEQFLPRPPKREQEKIAQILSDIDAVIDKVGTEIEKTQELKKGLMRQLLTRGIGHKNFKETSRGPIPTAWEVLPIKALAEAMLNGGTPDTTNKLYWSGTIPWISGADFSNQKVGVFRRHITHEAVKNSATNLIPKGALLVVTRTGVGKLAIAPVDITISQDITGIIPKASLISAGFMFWMLNLYIGKLKANHQGTSINGILREDLESFLLPIPPLPEQQEITSVLMGCDDSLNKQDLSLTKLTALKKSLMNMLLTGKVRVS